MSTMTVDRTVDLMVRSGALMRGHFKLTSGLHSDEYCQCALVLEQPEMAEELGRMLADMFRDEAVDVVVSPAIGGIVIGHEVARALGVRSLFAERSETGMAFRRGFRIAPSERVLIIEDGPTVTHGEMSYGAAHVAACEHGAGTIVDPRPFAVGSIKEIFQKYTHVKEDLPAMGYGVEQMRELEATINGADCDLVLVGTPIDLGALLTINKPSMRVRYELGTEAAAALKIEIERTLKARGA